VTPSKEEEEEEEKEEEKEENIIIRGRCEVMDVLLLLSLNLHR
jgi:hypothetical protein